MKRRNPEMKTDRLEIFSDAVFAITITLLILEVKVPKPDDLLQAEGLSDYLLQLWPNYFSYAISFIIIGIYWSNNHWAFTFIIKKTDHILNLLNILGLMTIAVMPFTTAILGDYLLDPNYRNVAIRTSCISFFLPIPVNSGVLFISLQFIAMAIVLLFF